MTVGSALAAINQEVDLYFNAQEGELDRESRFCVALYTQYGFGNLKFGDADTMSRARNTSVDALENKQVLFAQKGVVHLLERKDLPEKVSPHETMIWLLTQQLTRTLEEKGIMGCAALAADMRGANAEFAKDLAYRLYTIADRKGQSQEAYAYNNLVVSWPEIQSQAAAIRASVLKQINLFSTE